MIPFNPELIRFEYVRLKSVSTALGGSLRILDQELSDRADEQITVRYEVPFAVARQYQKRNKPSSYLIPVDACIVWYGDQIVNIEKRSVAINHDRNGIDMTDLNGGNTWPADSEICFNKYVLLMVSKTDRWYTDGIYLYELPENISNVIRDATRLTNDGIFRGVSVQALKLADLQHKELIRNPATRSIVACVQSNGQVILTPPIWKNVLDVRKGNLTVDPKAPKCGRFDLIEENFSVNLEFALNAGKTIGSIFGYNHISPLNLDELMIHLRTVNLPKVPKFVRATFGISIPFLQAFAWVAGLTAKCETMSDFVKMRGLMKQLCTKGIFKTSLLQCVHKTSNTAPPLAINKEEALEMVATTYKDRELELYWKATNVKADKKFGGSDQSVRNAIGAMVEY